MTPSCSTLTAGVVGVGFIGSVHLEALRRLGRPIAGLVGSTPEKGRLAAERLHLPRSYSNLEELLTDPGVSVVHLASPNHLHFEQCKAVLTAGKHVICEKPLALTSQETAELVQLAHKAKTVAALCYNVRFYPLCHEIRQRIQDGTIGKVYHVAGSYCQDWLLHETDYNWRVTTEQGGALRAVADIGTHWLDLATWMTGLEVESVCADLRTYLPTRQRPRGSVETFQGKLATEQGTEPVTVTTEDYGSMLLRFRGGANGVATISQVVAGRKNCLRIEIAGSRGSLAWNSERPDELWIGHRDRASELLQRDPALLTPGARTISNYPGGHAEGFPDTFKQLFATIYRYLEQEEYQAPRPFPTFEDGHQEALLCEAILASKKQNHWVQVET